MGSGYSYIRIDAEDEDGGLYLHRHQNPFALARLLYLTDMRRLRRWGFGKRSIMRLVQRRLHLGRNGSDLKLPVVGNLCLKAHNGYLLFDLERRAVTKVFDEKVEGRHVRREIETMKLVSLMDFVPTLRDWSEEERWYVMDYVDSEPGGIVSADGSNFYDVYYRHIEGCIESLILLKPPVAVSTEGYIKTVVKAAMESDTHCSFPDNVRSFLNSVAARVQTTGRAYLIFSHGDFGFHNIMKVKDGVAVIDWEEAGMRSVLFDLLNIFFTMRRREGFLKAPKIIEAVNSLKARLITKAPAIAASIGESADMYRWLFYVEKVQRLLQRDLTPRRLEDISSSIDAFSRIEEQFCKGEANGWLDR